MSLLEAFFAYGLVDIITERRTRSLNGLNVACYYGCLLVRPPGVTGAEHFEYPEMMDRIMDLLGATVIPWSYKTDCCGGSLVLTKTEIVLRLVEKLLDNAARAGADALVVACPLCQSNLDSRQEDIFKQTGTRYDLPLFYFTELIALSLNYPDVPRWWKRHFVDPRKLNEGSCRKSKNDKDEQDRCGHGRGRRRGRHAGGP